MENIKPISEPLRITSTGKYELSDYTGSKEIAITRALLLSPYLENNLNTTIRIIEKESQKEFDRFMIKAFIDPNRPENDKVNITGKFFNPKKHYIRIELKNTSDEVNFLLYFSTY